jgi:hypothetical protein
VSVRRTAAALAAPLAALTLAAAGCGGDDESASGTTPSADAGPTTAVAPTTGPTATVPTTATTTPTATTGVPVGGVTQTQAATSTSTAESGAGGAGDEEPIRSPVALTYSGGRLSPTVVTVPAFLALEILLTAKDEAVKATISAPGGGTLSATAGGTAVKRLDGLKPGDYTVTAPGGAKTTLRVVNGGDPGP